MSIKTAIDAKSGKNSKNIEDAINNLELSSGSEYPRFPAVWGMKGTPEELFGNAEMIALSNPNEGSGGTPFAPGVILPAPQYLINALGADASGSMTGMPSFYCLSFYKNSSGEGLIRNINNRNFFKKTSVIASEIYGVQPTPSSLSIGYYDSHFIAAVPKRCGTEEEAMSKEAFMSWISTQGNFTYLQFDICISVDTVTA